MSEGSEKPPSPYDSMKDETIKEHLSEIAKVLNGRTIDVDLYKMFSLQKGETVSEEDKKKIEEHAKFSAIVQQIQEVVGAKEGESVNTSSTESVPMDPNVERVAKMSLDNAIKEIKAVDEGFPVEEVLGGDRSVFDKIEIADGLKKVADYHKKSMDGLRSTVGDGSSTAKFSSPSTCDWDKTTNGLQSGIDDALKAVESVE